MPSSVASSRTCSSVSKCVGPFLLLSSIGRIWLLKCPALRAAAARRWLSTANASCCSRVMPHLVATFSAVMPMWIVSNGSVSAPTIMSTILLSPMRCAPALRQDRVDRAAHALGAAADRRVGVAEQDVCARRHDRLHAAAAQPVHGQRAAFRAADPPLIAATREMYMSFASVWITLPITHWPISAGSTFARATASRTTLRAELAGRDVLQAAAVVADGGADAGKDDDSLRWPVMGHSSLVHGGSMIRGPPSAPTVRRGTG